MLSLINKCLLIVCFTILIYEHIGRRYDIIVRPSVGLEYVANKSIDFFKKIGILFAWVSSYLTEIDLYDMYQTLYDIVTPLIKLLFAPFYFCYGYLLEVATYENKWWMIYVGSGIIIAMLIFISYKLLCRYPESSISKYIFKKN